MTTDCSTNLFGFTDVEDAKLLLALMVAPLPQTPVLYCSEQRIVRSG